jgi:sugar-specific transcriptional regulator TrmB
MKVKLDKNMEEFLAEFELSDREVAIYITLLQTGPNTIMNLARETGIKRSTTHNNVEELIKKGLVSQTNYGERRMVVAESPDKLQFLLDQKKFKVQKLEKNLPSVIDQINSMVPESDARNEVEVKYYDGNSGIELIYEEALSAKELRSYANVEKILEAFPDNESKFTEYHAKNSELKLWEIVEDSKASRKYAEKFAEKKRYNYKFTTNAIALSAIDVLIYDGKVGIINIKDGLTGIVITNEEYYENSKAIFDFIWSILE